MRKEVSTNSIELDSELVSFVISPILIIPFYQNECTVSFFKEHKEDSFSFQDKEYSFLFALEDVLCYYPDLVEAVVNRALRVPDFSLEKNLHRAVRPSDNKRQYQYLLTVFKESKKG